MSPKKFASFMVRDDIGQSRTMVRLTPAERWAFVAGVLALASKSPVRGFLLVAYGEPVTVDDIKDQAAVSKAVAKGAVDKLIRLHVLEHDDNLGCLAVVNWSTYQVEPKDDPTAAERMRRYRARLKEEGVEYNVRDALRQQVFERDGYACLSCSSRHDLEADHIIPKSKGGPTTLDNLQTLCHDCNREKWTRNEQTNDLRHVTRNGYEPETSIGDAEPFARAIARREGEAK